MTSWLRAICFDHDAQLATSSCVASSARLHESQVAMSAFDFGKVSCAVQRGDPGARGARDEGFPDCQLPALPSDSLVKIQRQDVQLHTLQRTGHLTASCHQLARCWGSAWWGGNNAVGVLMWCAVNRETMEPPSSSRRTWASGR
eukprot:2037807-Rhodomonas_salina.3